MLRVCSTTEGRLNEYEHCGGPLHIGRNPVARPGVAICRIDDRYVSSNQMVLTPCDDRRWTLRNVSRNVPIHLADGATLAVGESTTVSLPLSFAVGKTRIVIDDSDAEASDPLPVGTVAAPWSQAAESLATQTLGDLWRDAGQAADAPLLAPSAEKLTHWFETIVGIQQAAVSTGDFYRDTARAVVELVGLDCGFVLRRTHNGWTVAARHANQQGDEIVFSHSILRRVLEQKRTFYQSLGPDAAAESLRGISAVVAAPIFDSGGQQVVGAVYGSRVSRLGTDEPAIRPLEAQVVQVLAAAVGAGMVRLQREAEIARRRVQFEQFFSPELTEALDRDPDLLEGRDREVTILFADVRGFSRLSEKLAPRETFRLIRDVMERLTQRIRQFDGVLVDYMGDGLLAMWNAPADQPDHAALATSAAVAMIDELPALTDSWREPLGGPLALGIGINTGPALVGNTGSRLKFKYAPLGHTVNLASRLEGATKHFGVPILLAETTARKLGEPMALRRLGKTLLAGMVRPIDVFDVAPDSNDPKWRAQRNAYEQALQLFESNRWAEACQRLQPLLSAGQTGYDVPSLTLMSRAIHCLQNPPGRFDPVFVLQTK